MTIILDNYTLPEKGPVTVAVSFEIKVTQELRKPTLKLLNTHVVSPEKSDFKNGRHAWKLMDSRKTRRFVDRAFCAVDGSFPGLLPAHLC